MKGKRLTASRPLLDREKLNQKQLLTQMYADLGMNAALLD
jgi:hypothetical protein